ncbi:MAG: 4Fe-4S binding protein [Firmicutes bacterium]|nr:4Fe-4S binding protein [Bacillota bacterium]
MSAKGEKERKTVRRKGIFATRIADTKTGRWRLERPVVTADRCIGCNICTRYCPVGVIAKGCPVRIDYDYCKGCGICTTVCPREAIHLEGESDNGHD